MRQAACPAAPARSAKLRVIDQVAEDGFKRSSWHASVIAYAALNRVVGRMIVVTINDLPGHRVVRVIGMVRGITVRSRSVVGNIGAGIQALFGGNITIFTKLAEQARSEAHDLMVGHAQASGANAIIGFRYDANEIQAGITEVLAYGTAVVVEPIR
jgi:uncharacterized protein YbjQ (UPF0145 family)